MIGIMAGWVLTVLTGILWPAYFLYDAKPLSVPRDKPNYKKILLLFLMSRLWIFIIGVIVLGKIPAVSDWVRWDAPHYLSLAQNGYANTGDARFHIVFYPLYPLCVKLLSVVCAGNYTAAGFLCSNVCLFGCACVLWKYTALESDQKTAERAVRYLLLSPLSLFFSIPYTESLFMLLAISSVYMARIRKFAPAILLGALCGATRMQGILVAVPIFYEMLQSEKLSPMREKFCLVLRVCPVALGFVSYLLLNKVVTGNAFTFLQYQKEHWFQEFGSLANTLTYSLENALSYDNMAYRLTVWIPQTVFIPLFLALLFLMAKRLRTGDAAFSILYYYVSVVPTWLLSGCRYLSAMYTVYPCLAKATDKKWKDAAVSLALCLGSVYFIYGFLAVGTLM